jgi:hypothetical protein
MDADTKAKMKSTLDSMSKLLGDEPVDLKEMLASDPLLRHAVTHAMKTDLSQCMHKLVNLCALLPLAPAQKAKADALEEAAIQFLIEMEEGENRTVVEACLRETPGHEELIEARGQVRH